MTDAHADFVLQLGDFCLPREANREFLAAWNAFAGPRYHVLGNHDMDDGCTREQVAAFLGMPARHYTFDGGAVPGRRARRQRTGRQEPTGTRATSLANSSPGWSGTLASAAKPAIVFVHQPLDDDFGVENGTEVRAVLERAEAAASRPRARDVRRSPARGLLRTLGGLRCTCSQQRVVLLARRGRRVARGVSRLRRMRATRA